MKSGGRSGGAGTWGTALEERALEEWALEEQALEWGWALRIPGVAPNLGALGLEPAGLTAERPAGLTAEPWTAAGLPQEQRRACHSDGRRQAWLGRERRRACVGHEQQAGVSCGRRRACHRNSWRACHRNSRKACHSGGWRQAWLGREWQRACVGHEQQAGESCGRRAGSGSGLDTLQTPEDLFSPAESGGVWEVHGAMVDDPDPEQRV